MLSRSVTCSRFSLGHLVIPMSGAPFISGRYLQTPAHIKCCLNNRESHIDRLDRVVSEQVLHILLLCCSLGYEESIKERILGMWVRMAWGMILRKCEMVIMCPYTQSTLQRVREFMLSTENQIKGLRWEGEHRKEQVKRFITFHGILFYGILQSISE